MSCSQGEFSFEEKSLGRGHGVFFYHVIEGLKGAAKDADGQITWDGLALYVRSKVPPTVQKLFGKDGGEQSPNAIGNLRGVPTVLAIAPLGIRAAPKPQNENVPAKPEERTLQTSRMSRTGGRPDNDGHPAAPAASQPAQSQIVKNHLKQVALAMLLYHQVYRHFPPAAIKDAHGQPILSWRVRLLPYLGEFALYDEFHLDEPWDSPHNKKLIAKMPGNFAPSSAKLREQGKTTVVAPVGADNFR